MGLEQKHTHIGHFNKEQCEQVLAFCEQYEICGGDHRYEGGDFDVEAGLPILVCKNCGHVRIDYQEAHKLGLLTESEASDANSNP